MSPAMMKWCNIEMITDGDDDGAEILVAFFPIGCCQSEF